MAEDLDYDEFLAEVNGLAAGGVKKGPTCGFKLVLDELREKSPDVADAVAAAADNPNVFGTQIAKSLTKRGFPINSRTIMRHRRRLEQGADGCRCEV